MSIGYNKGSNNFVIANSDSIKSNQRMVIHSGGNVGIGTTSPNSKLTVAGRMEFFSDGFDGSDTGAYYLEKIRHFYNSNELRLTINDDWNETFQI
jgi:hypothetical protein